MFERGYPDKAFAKDGIVGTRGQLNSSRYSICLWVDSNESRWLSYEPNRAGAYRNSTLRVRWIGCNFSKSLARRRIDTQQRVSSAAWHPDRSKSISQSGAGALNVNDQPDLI